MDGITIVTGRTNQVQDLSHDHQGFIVSCECDYLKIFSSDNQNPYIVSIQKPHIVSFRARRTQKNALCNKF